MYVYLWSVKEFVGVLKPQQSHGWSVTELGFKPGMSESYLYAKREL